jgi:hypothetical protein
VVTGRLRLFERFGELKRLPGVQQEESVALQLFREVIARVVEADREDDVVDALDWMVARGAGAALLGDCPAEFVADDEGRRTWHALSRQSAMAALADAPPAVATYYAERFDHLWARFHGVGIAQAPAVARRLARLAEAPRAGYASRDRVKCIPFPRETQGEHSVVCALIAAVLARERDVDIVGPCVMALFHHLPATMLPMIDHEAAALIGHAAAAALESRALARSLADLPPFSRGLIAKALARYESAAPACTEDPFVEADILDRVLQVRYYERVASLTVASASRDHGLLNEGPLGDAQRRILTAYGLVRGDIS